MVDRDHAAVQDIFREWRSKPISESLWLLEYGWSDVDATHSIEQTAKLADHVTKEAVNRGLCMADEGMEMKAQDLTGANPTSVANIAHIAVHSKHEEEREVARRIYDHVMKNLPRDNF